MNNLKDLQEKLRFSLGEYLIEEDEDEKDEDEKDDKKKKNDKSRAYVYRSTSRETKGRAIQLRYDVDYKELKDYLEEYVPNISWSLPKVRETFKAIRKFMGFDKKNSKE